MSGILDGLKKKVEKEVEKRMGPAVLEMQKLETELSKLNKNIDELNKNIKQLIEVIKNAKQRRV